MNSDQVRQWQEVLNVAEDEEEGRRAVPPLSENLPATTQLGAVFNEPTEDGSVRVWKRVRVVRGRVGGRWAYWDLWKDAAGLNGIGPNPSHLVVADSIFNGGAPHFAGMLLLPYPGVGMGVFETWVLVEPKLPPPPQPWVDKPKPDVRYERSKEVFDVETGESKELK